MSMVLASRSQATSTPSSGNAYPAGQSCSCGQLHGQMLLGDERVLSQLYAQYPCSSD
jgi:hypothetical protein